MLALDFLTHVQSLGSGQCCCLTALIRFDPHLGLLSVWSFVCSPKVLQFPPKTCQ